MCEAPKALSTSAFASMRAATCVRTPWGAPPSSRLRGCVGSREHKSMRLERVARKRGGGGRVCAFGEEACGNDKECKKKGTPALALAAKYQL